MLLTMGAVNFVSLLAVSLGDIHMLSVDSGQCSENANKHDSVWPIVYTTWLWCPLTEVDLVVFVKLKC